jgi:septal ring factor EnvC (AmiA/AmiB activator)
MNKRFLRPVLVFLLVSAPVLLNPAVTAASEPAKKPAGGYDSLIKKYKKQIEKKSSDLSDIQKQIRDKKEEKEKYKKEEQQVRKDLNRIERELSQISSEITRMKSNIRKTQKNLERAGNDIKMAQTEKGHVQSLLRNELSEAGKRRIAASLFEDPWDEPVKRCIIKSKSAGVAAAQSRKTTAENAYREYSRIKGELNSLEAQLVKKQAAQEEVKKEKSAILATTQGRRIAAEEDFRRLNETGSELKKLIQKLEEQKQETFEMKRQEEAAHKEFTEKRGVLPWPAAGKPVSHFGRNKHPELDTYVINNGIKIQTQPNQPVSAVDRGEVVYAQVFMSYGKTVIIDHKGGTYTIYGNLGEILVDDGAKVSAGQQVGRTGPGEKDFLYFEIRIDGQPQDPTGWLTP